jgi:hypothetical protein
MQRPPRPVLLSRPIYDWISRVSRLHTKLTELKLSVEQQSRLLSWIETRFVYSALTISGANPDLSRIAVLVASSSATAGGASSEDQPIIELVKGLRNIEDLIKEKGKSAELTPDLILSLSGNNPGYRKGEGELLRGIRPINAGRVASSVEAACAWFTAESFAELNPVEQASIAYLRLLEIQPFETSTVSYALVAASFFTLRAGLPPVIIDPDHTSSFDRALEEGSRMDTKPMVELVASSLERTLADGIKLISEKDP